MLYALGTDATTAPTSGWGTSIPTGTEVGTYYVWYKVEGDDFHYDLEPVSVEATIEKDKDNELIASNKVVKEEDDPGGRLYRKLSQQYALLL